MAQLLGSFPDLPFLVEESGRAFRGHSTIAMFPKIDRAPKRLLKPKLWCVPEQPEWFSLHWWKWAAAVVQTALQHLSPPGLPQPVVKCSHSLCLHTDRPGERALKLDKGGSISGSSGLPPSAAFTLYLHFFGCSSLLLLNSREIFASRPMPK